MSKFNYENKDYLKKLDDLGLNYYSTYIKLIEEFLPQKQDKFLDVGCGNGIVLLKLSEKGFKNGYGLDVSKLFIREAKKRGVENVSYYDGSKFPFKEKSFNLVGSFNVLEHVENPEEFIASQIKLLKKNGVLIIACPNFLSCMLFDNWHPRLNGGRRKINNVLIVISKMFSSHGFEKMEPIRLVKFKYDSDAIVVTNLIDIEKVIKDNNCLIKYESGFIQYNNFVTKMINLIPFTRHLSPSCLVVAQKR